MPGLYVPDSNRRSKGGISLRIFVRPSAGVFPRGPEDIVQLFFFQGLLHGHEVPDQKLFRDGFALLRMGEEAFAIF